MNLANNQDNQTDSTATSKKMEDSSNNYSESTGLLKQQSSESAGGTAYASDGETAVRPLTITLYSVAVCDGGTC